MHTVPVVERDLRDMTCVTFLYYGIIRLSRSIWIVSIDLILEHWFHSFQRHQVCEKVIAPSLSYDSPNFAQNHPLKFGTLSGILGAFSKFFTIRDILEGVLFGHFRTRFKRLGSGIII